MQSTFSTHSQDWIDRSIAEQTTLQLPAVAPVEEVTPPESVSTEQRQKRARIVAVVLACALALTLFLIWRTPVSQTSSLPIVQPQAGPKQAAAEAEKSTAAALAGSIQVQVVGAVKSPGVYTLSANARVFQLVEVAGGALPDANLMAINLAAKLTDGQQVYVPTKGEKTSPILAGGTAGQLVNINTASNSEMREKLSISSTTAQKIIDYRTLHGPFTSVEQLLEVVSDSIYKKIKDKVSV